MTGSKIDKGLAPVVGVHAVHEPKVVRVEPTGPRLRRDSEGDRLRVQLIRLNIFRIRVIRYPFKFVG